jgi:hypothetical protein
MELPELLLGMEAAQPIVDKRAVIGVCSFATCYETYSGVLCQNDHLGENPDAADAPMPQSFQQGSTLVSKEHSPLDRVRDRAATAVAGYRRKYRQ